MLAAVLIRLLIEATFRVEHRVAAFFTSRGGAAATVGRVFGAWLVLFLSKFVILEAVDIVFGEHVELGGFLWIIFLSAAMVIAERVVVATYRRL